MLRMTIPLSAVHGKHAVGITRFRLRANVCQAQPPVIVHNVCPRLGVVGVAIRGSNHYQWMS